jgi:hypothetical protein
MVSDQCGGSYNWLHKSSELVENIPQGLKPQILCGFFGTTEVVPFHGAIYAAGSTEG